MRQISELSQEEYWIVSIAFASREAMVTDKNRHLIINLMGDGYFHQMGVNNFVLTPEASKLVNEERIRRDIARNARILGSVFIEGQMISDIINDTIAAQNLTDVPSNQWPDWAKAYATLLDLISADGEQHA